jgi:hypothetical protein
VTSWKHVVAAALPALILGFATVFYSPVSFDAPISWPLFALGTLVTGGYLATVEQPAAALGTGLYLVALAVFFVPVSVFVLPLFTQADPADVLVSIFGVVSVGVITTGAAIVLAAMGYVATGRAES